MKENEQKKLEEMTFEEAMQRLEEVVQKLEAGDVPLEQAVELFQEGMALSKRCSQQLEATEKRIEMLMEENGEWVKQPFHPEGDSS